MGASGWAHFGPYDQNFTRAIATLCQNVFDAGDYLQLWRPIEEQRALIAEATDRFIADHGLDYVLKVYQYNLKGITPTTRDDIIEIRLSNQIEPPRSIQELIRYNRLEGTHSILDYTHDGNYNLLPAEAIAQRLRPISDKGLLHVFGTTHPSHQQIEAQEGKLWDYVLHEAEEVEGDYIVVYEKRQPAEIYVMGISGD